MIQMFRGIDGILALPPAVAVMTVLIFLGYGFRPELLPFAFVIAVIVLAGLPRLLDMAHRLRMDDYGEGSRVGIFFSLLIVAATVNFAIAFTPREKPETYRPLITKTIERDEGRNTDLYFEYYSGLPPQTASAVLIVSPPPIGSAGILETYMETLAGRGITAVVVTRKSVDAVVSPDGGWIGFPSAGDLISLAYSNVAGTRFVFAAKRGADLERDRAADLSFAIRRVRSAIANGESPLAGADPSRIAVAGFAEGGAGAILCASESEEGIVLAVVSIESPIRSSLSGGPQNGGDDEQDVSANLVLAFAGKLLSAVRAFLPEPIAGVGDVPTSRAPSLFIVSDRIADPKERDGRYASLIRAFRKALAPSMLVSFAGAGPRDFTDVPYKYPVLSAMAGGREKTDGSMDAGGYSAAAANATADFLDRAADISERGIPADYPIGRGMSAELAGLWKSGAAEGILRP